LPIKEYRKDIFCHLTQKGTHAPKEFFEINNNKQHTPRGKDTSGEKERNQNHENQQQHYGYQQPQTVRN
jgi:hypothetical protein